MVEQLGRAGQGARRFDCHFQRVDGLVQPIRRVAALHDTSVAMIERHYSRWITDGLDEMAARAVVPLIGAIAA